MSDAIRNVTTATAVVIFAVLIFPGKAAPTTVDQFFNNMSEDQETAYILTMAKAAEKILSDAGKPELARRVETLFPDAAKQRTESDAIEEFKQAVDAFAREELVRQAAGEMSVDSPFLVEEMMIGELRSHQIDMPPSFIAAARAGKLASLTAPAPASRAAPRLGTAPAPAQTDPCLVLTAAEARSVMGVAMEFKGHDDATCKYQQVGFSDNAPNNRTLWLSIYTRPKANPNAVTDQLDNFKRYYSPQPLSITNITDVGDAALWAWRGDLGGELFAYSSGNVEVQVWIRGLPQQPAYSAARALAVKSLGSGGRTGFGYAK